MLHYFSELVCDGIKYRGNNNSSYILDSRFIFINFNLNKSESK